MWQLANEVTPSTGSTLSGGRGDPHRLRESFTVFSVLPAMDRKQKQAKKVQYAQAAVTNTFLFLPVLLFFYASVILPPVFLIHSPNLSLTALLRSHKDSAAQNQGSFWGALSPCRLALSSLCLTAGRRCGDSYFLTVLEVKGRVLSGFAFSVH